MDRRFFTFLTIALLVLVVNQVVVRLIRGPQPAAQPAAQADKGPAKQDPAKAKQPDKEKEPDAQPPAAEVVAADENQAKPDQPAEAEANIALEKVALGSADPDSGFRMLVTLTNRGAAIERAELNSPRYLDLENRSGFLGHLDLADAKQGVRVGFVGRDTPADRAGLKRGDLIRSLDKAPIANEAAWHDALAETKPGQKIELDVLRDDKPQAISVTLAREPLSVIRPELDTKPIAGAVKPGNHDPLSMLLGLKQLDGKDVKEGEPFDQGLREGNWQVEKSAVNTVTFRKRLPAQQLEIVKRYTLAKGATDEPLYHLTMSIEIQNTAEKAVNLAYELNGFTGLPTEGEWYANKIGRHWGASGLRDVLVRFEKRDPTQISCNDIVAEKFTPWIAPPPLSYIAVDAQYFAAALIPLHPDLGQAAFAEVKPTRVGTVPQEAAQKRLTDVSFQLVSGVEPIEPGKKLAHEFQLFVGPKEPALLAQYGPAPATLSDLVYYGWFFFVAEPMLSVLHAFYALVGNYGIAIIMLTVLVRGCMFPLSRKQAVSAQKMQELQPEMKRIAEKYKKSPEQRTKAQQELFRKNNYNPLGGCLLMFIQLPIFVGLYRSLMVDVELRQAPLFGPAIRWASNLASPDMFLDWSNSMPAFVTQGTGFFGLGPYLNILPLVTIALFIWQQKMFMPPPADEQAAMQQKIMKYMMIFMGFMFFKVASGLCIYFIASSLWGIAERKLLPKINPTAGQPQSGGSAVATASANGNGAGSARKKQRDRKLR